MPKLTTRRWRLALCCMLSAVLAPAVPAQAAYSPFDLVSGSPTLGLQANYAYDAAISANGRYVAFTGAIASVPGIYRAELGGAGTVEVVALGAETGAPSISEAGNYVSFTTDDDPLTGEYTGKTLAGEALGECSSVYVRDMGRPASAAGSYTLASAENSGKSLAYKQEPGQPCGAAAAYRVALSGNGQKVVFTTLSPSSLTGPCEPAPSGESCPTPADQVVLRSLEAGRESTQLVSATLSSIESGGEPQPVPGGAAIAGPSTQASHFEKHPTSASTAAIDADGNAVAWMGIDVQEQTALAAAPENGGPLGYAEPLWRLLEGPSSPTRSVLSGNDASALQCPPTCGGGLDLLWHEGEEEETDPRGPIRGSYTDATGSGFGATGSGSDPLDVVTPQLSANGMEVALLSTQPGYCAEPVAEQCERREYQPKGVGPPGSANAFVVNMTPGLSRAESITRLSEWTWPNLKDEALNGAVDEIAISPNGQQVALTTTRTAFPLAPPALITPQLSQAINEQLYIADLPAETLQLVSQGYEGQPANDGILDVSLDDDGDTIALASAATNLTFGTAATPSAVFVTHEINSPASAGQQSVSAPPVGSPPTPQWRISATAAPSPNGSLLLYVSVPGAGVLSASARASVELPRPHAARAGAHPRTSKPRTKKADRSLATRAALALTQVASSRMATTAAGVVELRLTPLPRYRSLLSGHGGLYANVTIVFTAAGHPRQSEELAAAFTAPRSHPRRHAVSTHRRSVRRRSSRSHG